MRLDLPRGEGILDQREGYPQPVLPYQSNNTVRTTLHTIYKGSGTLRRYLIQAPAFYFAFPYQEDGKYMNPRENQEGMFSVH